MKKKSKLGVKLVKNTQFWKLKPNCKKRPNIEFKSGLVEHLIERKHEEKGQIVLNWKYIEPMIKTKIVPKLRE